MLLFSGADPSDTPPIEWTVTGTLDMQLGADEQLSLPHVGCWVDDVVVARLGSTVTAPDGSFAVVETGGDSTLVTRMRGPYAQVFNRGAGGVQATLTAPPTAASASPSATSPAAPAPAPRSSKRPPAPVKEAPSKTLSSPARNPFFGCSTVNLPSRKPSRECESGFTSGKGWSNDI